MKKLLIAIMFGLMSTILFACSADDEVTAQEELAQEDAEKQKEEEEAAARAEEEKLAAEQKAKEEEKARQEAAEKEAALLKQQEKDIQARNLGLVGVTISRVVDGDTVELEDGQKVRLIGVNTPESTTRIEDYGKEASDYTKSKLTGQKVWLQKDVSETDRYQRLLRIVWLDIPTNLMDEKEIRSKMFNADLVLNGYAEPSTYPPDVKYSEYFVKFAREAREKNTGLWAYGENGTTKGDLDSETTSKTAAAPASKSTSSNSGSNTSGEKTSTNTEAESEYFANCTELRKVYPKGVPSDHPAYQAKMDRDKDGWACER